MPTTSPNAPGVQTSRTKGPAAFWDGIAEKYSRQPVADPAAFQKKIAITKDLMHSDHIVLDVGCGTGSLALILAPFAKHVHGLDLSQEMIRIARAKAETVSNVTFHVGNWDNTLAVEPETLDGICAFSVLHLLEDPAAALAHFHRLLKPGGFFVASTVCLAESWVPYSPLLRAMRWFGKAPFVNILSKSDVLGRLERAGFDGISAPDVGAKSEVLFTVARKPLGLGSIGCSTPSRQGLPAPS
jgi:ubiquinone/menaquinone biosynthesis C-methylase UbiE